MVTGLFFAGLALALALLVAIYRKLEAMPLRLWGLAREEQAHREGKALAAWQEVVAARVKASVVSLQSFHDQSAAIFRAQVADAETRARIAERRAAEVGVGIGAASELVRELRVLRDELTAIICEGTPAVSPPLAAPAAEPSEGPPR
jgi:hypothetical protein